MPSPHGRARTGPLWPLGVLLLVFVVVDPLLPAMERVGRWRGGEFMVGLMAGLICAQAGLLTLWAVFGPQPLALRWIITLGAAELLLVTFLAGSLLGREGRLSWEDFVIPPLVLPLVFLVLQAPFGLFRAVTGWRIAVEGREDVSGGARQFRIVDLLTVTLIVAVTLGLTRGAVSLGEPDLEDMAQIWLMSAIYFAILAAVNGLLALPCFWAVFAARHKLRAAAILMVYYFLLTFGYIALISLLTGGSMPTEEIAEVIGVMVVFVAVYVAVFAGGLCLLRAGGYVLLRPRRRPAGAEQGASPFAPEAP